MQKIIVIGCPGSGKSTFSKRLHQICGIELVHLDNLYWNKDKTAVQREVFLERLGRVMQKSAWIIDGNYSSTMEARLRQCDTVIFLDYPTKVCLDGIKARRGQKRSDIPWVEKEEDLELAEYVKNFSAGERARIIELLRQYSDKNIFVFSNRSEAQSFLENQAAKQRGF